MANFLIRVRLPDRPGALGAVASRIGAVGADVVSIDILQRTEGQVVDELGVVTATEDLAELLAGEILEVDGVSLEEMRSVDGPLPDRQAELIGAAGALVRQTTAAGVLAQLVARARRSLSATFVLLVEAASGEVVVSDGEPPPGSGRPAPDRTWGDGTLAVPLDGPGLVLVAGRRTPVLREREQQRIAALAELADHRWRELHDRVAAG